ncbi:MAG: hypothetical protein IKI21_07300 [Oscillospiraceae bacterium]|nr:hypothetical protein [Oscillospiraceae bacterium]
MDYQAFCEWVQRDGTQAEFAARYPFAGIDRVVPEWVISGGSDVLFESDWHIRCNSPRWVFEDPNVRAVILGTRRWSLHSGMFSTITHLEVVWIPASLGRIDAGAFQGCDSLTDVFYEGTAPEWDKIHVVEHLDRVTSTGMGARFTQWRVPLEGNEVLHRAVIHFGCSRLALATEEADSK